MHGVFHVVVQSEWVVASPIHLSVNTYTADGSHRGAQPSGIAPHQPLAPGSAGKRNTRAIIHTCTHARAHNGTDPRLPLAHAICNHKECQWPCSAQRCSSAFDTATYRLFHHHPIEHTHAHTHTAPSPTVHTYCDKWIRLCNHTYIHTYTYCNKSYVVMLECPTFRSLQLVPSPPPSPFSRALSPTPACFSHETRPRRSCLSSRLVIHS